MTERFELVEEVGRGAMGVVWKARDNERGKIVAVKMLRDLHLDDAEYVDRFAREVDLARSVRSPHVVRVRGYGVRQGVPFVVLEFVTGQSLRAYVADRGPFPPSVARDLLAQTAEALVAVHAVGIIHRDVKASNVLLTDDGVAKLTDFGIARGGDNQGHTRRGSLLGTPAYMAPEGPVDARSDLYSLGVLYYELLSGVLPFTSTNYQEVILAHVQSTPDLSRLPASERGLTGWMMSKNPTGRPQSAAALLASLGSKGAGSPGRPPAPQPQRQPIPRPAPQVAPQPAPSAAPQTIARYRPAPPPTPTSTPSPSPYSPTVMAPSPSTPPPTWRPTDATGRPAQKRSTEARDQQTMMVAIAVGAISLLAISGVVLLAAVSSRSAAASGSASGQNPAGAVLALVAVAVLALGAVGAAVVLAMFQTRSRAARNRGSARPNRRGGPPGPYRRGAPPNQPPPGGQRGG